ncbi:hypothetical protein [Mycobacterium sherrisii]|uniref:Uncharacterized protein n=1 Tax=Mycobacterium sherrisii TaxID=243061 RepID=A0A1E3T5M5_9MYCO|nr:hypothetical protein [Mycobacterium sherrisii]MCV7029676.1 hypothetical protein [Mycobacterium sherrisii]MEC4762297.1 hypothetical protein [Mycobacterium sherrisii]ODR09670.1 hypothetical protein BHQ21_03470 [Mycobacterium sherrisii]ORW74965.1 hypothetical protein AWC25_14860 [Mycobacterium sherrisii]
MTQGLYGLLTVVALVLALVLVAVAAVHVKRLGDRPALPISDEIGIAKTVTRKVRKGEPMSDEELAYAKQLVANRSSPLTFAIPGALFMVGSFYVFGSLYHLHGATPSERTFLGVFPMLASLNLTTQILRSARLRRRLRKAS